MPKNKKNKTPKPKKLAQQKCTPTELAPTEPTSEPTAFLQGLYDEFQQQVHRYHHLTEQLLELEARVELHEKMVCVSREHLSLAIDETEDAVPHDWGMTLASVQFVGMRLADACVALLKKYKKMMPVELLQRLNGGTFRFRTNKPLREIHAALLRQNSVERDDSGAWVWTGEGDQMPMRFRMVNATDTTPNRENATPEESVKVS